MRQVHEHQRCRNKDRRWERDTEGVRQGGRQKSGTIKEKGRGVVRDSEWGDTEGNREQVKNEVSQVPKHGISEKQDRTEGSVNRADERIV